jgi:hypothetical protein
MKYAGYSISRSFPDLVVGRADANAFYDELLMVSKNNRRNSADYANYVKKPVSDLLVEKQSGQVMTNPFVIVYQ